MDSKVICWGTVPILDSRNGPMQIPGLPDNIIDIATGFSHICILVQTGGVQCWGYNAEGELGNGTTDPRLPTVSPTDVVGLTSHVQAIAAGYGSTCALMDTGAMKCWGMNMYGQLGDGTKQDRYAPVDVIGLSTPVKSISAGSGAICAVDQNGGLQCWGMNLYGQLGTGDTAEHLSPQTVAGLGAGVSSISVGGTYSCAVLTDGKVKCWGELYLNMRNHSPLVQLTPTEITDLPQDVSTVGVGGNHVCVSTTQGVVDCWGYNHYGQLGDGTLTDRPTPVTITGLDQEAIVGLSLGNEHSCALAADSKVFCWGRNWFGQIGDGTSIQQFAPVRVAETDRQTVYTELSAFSSASCAVTQVGEVKCWGYDPGSALGDGSQDDYSRPTPVRNLPLGMHGIKVGAFWGCGITSTGGVECWGLVQVPSVVSPYLVDGLDHGVVSLAAGSNFACALLDTGGVKCWGSNTYGQLGDGTKTDHQASPVDVVGLTSGVAAITAGEVHTCALMIDGSAKCWGANGVGQLGDGTQTDSLTPVSVKGLAPGLTDLSSGTTTTCAWNHAGSTRCWGSNGFGQFGTFDVGFNVTTAAPLSGISGSIRSIGMGFGQICVVSGDGSLRCWGLNDDGQVGNRSTTETFQPTLIFGPEQKVAGVTGGYYHTCAWMEDGSAACWGSNTNGQVGDGASIYVTSPSEVVGLDMQPVFFLRHRAGAPGSQFTLIGEHYPIYTSLLVIINGVSMGSFVTNSNGNFSLVLDTQDADVGSYQIIITSAPEPAQTGRSVGALGANSAQAVTTIAPSLTLDSSLEVINQDGGGTVFTIPAGLAIHFPKFTTILPLIRRR
jgi:alpha-tubulin suppressor-like RCC1 family protein